MSAKKVFNILNQVSIERPCLEPWDRMQGSKVRRHCEKCSKCVTNLSAMTRRNARKYLQQNISKDICVRYVNDANGNIKFQPSRIALAFAALLAMVGVTNSSLAETNAPTAKDSKIVEHPLMGGVTVSQPQPTATQEAVIMGELALPDWTPTPATSK